MTKKIPLNFILIAAIVVVGAASFFGGVKYSESKKAANSPVRNGSADFRGLSPEERNQRFGQMGANGQAAAMAGQAGRNGNGGGLRQNGANFSGGEIISKDSQSLTVKMADGGSKIILYSDATEISKSAAGTAADLEIGKSITVNGTANQDGSFVAKTIQIRPEISPEPPAK